jgi:hypothetical protein
MAMFELDFSGFASLPGSALAECMDAAGVDAGLGRHVHPVDADDAASCTTDPADNPH